MVWRAGMVNQSFTDMTRKKSALSQNLIAKRQLIAQIRLEGTRKITINSP
ncbi:hypothetical protein [Bradyrhizobium sp. CSA207]|nr:hypothetical protein [Bradyrhizobium sp. CSA207]